MNSSHMVVLLSLVLLLTTVTAVPADAQEAFPRLNSVTPDTASVGDELLVEGENLGKTHVKELYLTDGQTDWKTTILEQTDTSIKCTVPSDAKPGRFSLMVLTAAATPRLIEQPVKINIE